jgi:hypothetical protein
MSHVVVYRRRSVAPARPRHPEAAPVIRERLSGVVTGARPAAVYRWRSRAHPASVGRELAALGWGWYVLDGRTITGPASLFDQCADALAFPAWFGRTFEALADCLADLSWLPGRGHVLLWESAGVLARHDPRAWRQAYQVFSEAATGRPGAAPPLYLLLRGADPADVPVL